MPNKLKCPYIRFNAPDYCEKLKCGIPANLPRKALILVFFKEEGHNLLNVNFRGIHIFKTFFSI